MSEPTDGVPACYRHPDRETYIRCQRCNRPICPDCMTEATVGYQCPSCVSEGARSTRTGRTAYGGSRSARPALTSQVLIGINVAVWIAILVTGWSKSRLIDLLALRPAGFCEVGPGAFVVGRETCESGGGTFVAGVSDGAYWQLLTSVFTHVEPWHIGFNMLALWFLGPQLESVLGRTRFLALYLVSGLAGSVAVLWLSGTHQATLGASGAIFGLIGAMLVIGTKVGGDVSTLWGWLAANVVLTFVVPNVSWQGHLGGLVGGALVAAVLVYAPRERRGLMQGVGVGVLVFALAVATAVRLVMLA